MEVQLNADDEGADEGKGRKKGVCVGDPFPIKLFNSRSVSLAVFGDAINRGAAYSHDGIPVPEFRCHGGRTGRETKREAVHEGQLIDSNEDRESINYKGNKRKSRRRNDR
jgi:hypothetical protein